MNENLSKYQRMSVTKAVILNALPALAAMLMTLIYNLADTFFIGQTHDSYQVAAVSLATPVFLLFMSAGTVFGIGGTSVISRAFGEGRIDFAKKVCSFCMWSSVICGVVLSAVFLIFMEPFLSMLGASVDTWQYTKDYLTIVAFCGPFAVISSCFSNILRAEGQATKAMTGQIIGNVLNMCLDAVLIMVFHWDIIGCAIATLIGETAGAFYYLCFFWQKKSSLSISLKNFTVRNDVVKSVLSIGIPASLGSILMSISSIIMNALMAKYGDMALAGIGVAMKVIMITGMLSMGIGQGVQPLLGYSVGEKNWKRFNKTLRISVIFAAIVSVVLTIVCYLFRPQIIGVFLSDAESISYGMDFTNIMLWTGPAVGIFFVLTNALQAMGEAVPSFIINISRQGLVYIPVVFIMDGILGATGLAWGQPVADIVSLVMSIIFLIITLNKRIE